MKKRINKSMMIAALLVLLFNAVNAQKYITKNGEIMFYSETPLETIQADNRQVNSALDPLTGDFVFKVLMKSFQFEKALMQEHFNENYVESSKYPNAIFKGKITNLDQIDFNTPGTYNAMVEGDLTIHGVTQNIKEKGTFTVDNDVVKGHSKFMIDPKDYDIKIPKAVINNIADAIEVTVNVDMYKL